MEITLKQIKTGQQALVKILSHPMSIKLAYRIRKIASQLETELKFIEVARMELIKKYGDRVIDKEGKDTGQYQVSEKKVEDFVKEFENLLEEKVKTSIEKIPFECIENMQISPLELASIEVFIEGPKEDRV